MLIVTPVDYLAPPSAAAALMRWVRSTDGQNPVEDGESALSLLPRNEELVLALPPRALSWHRLSLPRVSGPRLRAALDGLLEDQVLSDVGALHHALEPGGRAGLVLPDGTLFGEGVKTRIKEGAQSIDVMNRTQGDEDWVLLRPWLQAPSNCIAPRAAAMKAPWA